MTITSGMNVDRAVDEAGRLGATVERLRNTGELSFRHPAMGGPCRVSGRRKDASRHLTGWLRRLRRRLGGEE